MGMYYSTSYVNFGLSTDNNFKSLIKVIQTGTILYQKLFHVRRGDGEKGVPQKGLYKFRVPSLKKD